MGSEFQSQGLDSGFSWLLSCLERRANSFSEHTVLVFRFAYNLYLVKTTLGFTYTDQEWVEALSFYHFLATGTVVNYDQVIQSYVDNI